MCNRCGRSHSDECLQGRTGVFQMLPGVPFHEGLSKCSDVESVRGHIYSSGQTSWSRGPDRGGPKTGEATSAWQPSGGAGRGRDLAKPSSELKTGDRALPLNPSQHPSSSRRKRSSQTSSELSSSEGCLAAEKGRENERKGRKTGELSPNFIYSKKSVLLQCIKMAYIALQTK